MRLLSGFAVLALVAGHLHDDPQAAREPFAEALAPVIDSLEQSTASVSAAAPTARAVFDRYCITCHNERLKTAGLALDKMDVGRIADGAETWEKVARKLRTHEMPPPGRPRPDLATYGSIASWLENALDDAAAANPNPGRVAVHRLNRTEYANAIRHLLGLEVDGRTLLFADEPDQQSFDTIASVLSVSPALLDDYIAAASKISRFAVGAHTDTPIVETYRVPASLVHDDRTSDDLPFGSQGGIVVRHHSPIDGEYSFKMVLRQSTVRLHHRNG